MPRSPIAAGLRLEALGRPKALARPPLRGLPFKIDARFRGPNFSALYLRQGRETLERIDEEMSSPPTNFPRLVVSSKPGSSAHIDWFLADPRVA